MGTAKTGKVTVEKIGRIVNQILSAGYTQKDGKVLFETLQEIHMRIYPNASNPSYPGLE